MSYKSHATFYKILLSSIFLVIFTYIFTVIALDKIENSVRIDMGKALNVVLKTTYESQTAWIEKQKYILQQDAKNKNVLTAAINLLKVPRTKEKLLDSQPLETLREYFDAKKINIENNGFFIISPDQINIGSMRDENIGTMNLVSQKYPHLIKKAFKGETIFVIPMQSDVPLQGNTLRNSPTMFFITPLKQNNKIIALLSIRISPNRDFTRITQIGRIGKTGETYAFNRSGFMISNSRFNQHLRKIDLLEEDEQEAILKIQITDPGENMSANSKADLSSHELTLMAKSAISGNSDLNVQGYRDYRGVRVVGSWLWSQTYGYGLTTEIDEQELLKSYTAIQHSVYTLTVAFLLFTILLLSSIFWLESNNIQTLKKSRDELEIKVGERTSELNSAYIELKNSIDNLKLLEGIIPICGYCKNIRNDEGSWDMLEKYLSRNTEAKFSHGICPECVKKIYAEEGLSEKKS